MYIQGNSYAWFYKLMVLAAGTLGHFHLDDLIQQEHRGVVILVVRATVLPHGVQYGFRSMKIHWQFNVSIPARLVSFANRDALFQFVQAMSLAFLGCMSRLRAQKGSHSINIESILSYLRTMLSCWSICVLNPIGHLSTARVVMVCFAPIESHPCGLHSTRR